MKAHATLWERFDGWFCKPIEQLKECPEGDGAFLAMSAGLSLCERYYRTKTNTQESQFFRDISFRTAAAVDLGVGPHEFEIFWTIFRHGIQHQGMPKKEHINGTEYVWRISQNYLAVPVFRPAGEKRIVIEIDPWKFADLIKSRYQQNPDILKDAVTHAFGEVCSE